MFVNNKRHNKCVIKLLQKMVEHENLFVRASKINKCNKAIDNYPQALEFVCECCKTQSICDKAVDTYLSQKNLFLNVL